jgi:hypothetical protein
MHKNSVKRPNTVNTPPYLKPRRGIHVLARKSQREYLQRIEQNNARCTFAGILSSNSNAIAHTRLTANMV